MKIKRDYKKIVDELVKIRKEIIVDLIVNLYSLAAFRKDFGEFFDSDITSENFIHAVVIISDVILRKHPEGLEQVMEKIISRNKKYIEFVGYHKFNIEKLIEEFNEDKSPSLHGEGVTPEMMLLYFYAENMFNHEYIPELIKQYEIHFQKAEEAKMRYMVDMFNNPTPPDLFEIERRLYEIEDLQNLDEVNWHEIGKQFKCEYDEQNKVFNKVPRGLIIFYDTNIKVLKEIKASYEDLMEGIEAIARKLYLSIEKQKNTWKHFTKAIEENRALKTQIKSLKKQLSELESKFKSLNKATPQTKEKQLTELLKENYYLKTRIEKLEQMIEQLQQAQEINKEITENIIISEPAVEEKPSKLPEYQTIVIVGGKWNSKEKELLQQALPNCDIKFVEAEKTISRIDTISNADIVIFDTSRNAHKYYYIVKENAKNLYLINKSTSNNVIELFLSGYKISE